MVMDSMEILKAMLPRVPMVLKTALLNTLSLSETEGKQDLRTELTVRILRSFIGYTVPIGKQQRGSLKDPGIKGPMWISKVTLPKPEIEVQEALIKVIEELKEGGETYDVPGLVDVEAEWTGHRGDANGKSTLPDISEEEKYSKLMEEVKEDMTILYFHGGAFFAMDPCTHRIITTKLAKLTGARVLSVRYRLAPQHPFPAALLDCLVAYLSLISPPPGSLHAPVPANKIVLAGDSAGGNFAISLLQTLLTLHRNNTTIPFHGTTIQTPIPLPAGAATNSPFCDVNRSLPSVVSNAKYDYLEPPIQVPGTLFKPYPFPSDSIWPPTPPRVDLYVNANATAHPLVSPVISSQKMWENSPPVFITMGEEGLSDEGLHLARTIHRAGSTALVERFEGMPHCFALIAPTTHAGKRCLQGWADFCLEAVRGGGKVERRGDGEEVTWINHSATRSKKERLEDVCALSEEEVERKVRDGRDWRVEGEEALRKALEEEVSKAKL
ncbi:hypothetical protein FQN54_004868 [Arachnomyces sp. PD_36]|nr:hypothetical protein FQN54_004868 [Arachnomyces sp. PD_36]